MTQSEIDTIANWVDGGTPEGNPSDLPAPRNFDGAWSLGQPDLVASNAEAYTPPASGDMYRCFTIPAHTTEDKYVSAIDFHPGDRKTVHHVDCTHRHLGNRRGSTTPIRSRATRASAVRASG